MAIPEKRRTGNSHSLRISGVSEHNLKNIAVSIPLGTFTCVTGVSGSGKSTLISDVLFPLLSNKLMRMFHDVGAASYGAAPASSKQTIDRP